MIIRPSKQCSPSEGGQERGKGGKVFYDLVCFLSGSGGGGEIQMNFAALIIKYNYNVQQCRFWYKFIRYCEYGFQAVWINQTCCRLQQT